MAAAKATAACSPKSFVLARDWLLEGRAGKVLRSVITKATSVGTDTRHAIENNPQPDPKDPTKTEAGRVPVLGLAGIKRPSRRRSSKPICKRIRRTRMGPKDTHGRNATDPHDRG